jgi:hypothetical protein
MACRNSTSCHTPTSRPTRAEVSILIQGCAGNLSVALSYAMHVLPRGTLQPRRLGMRVQRVCSDDPSCRDLSKGGKPVPEPLSSVGGQAGLRVSCRRVDPGRDVRDCCLCRAALLTVEIVLRGGG